jgi:hypothetical protein
MNLPEMILKHVEYLPATLQQEALDYVLYLEQKAKDQFPPDEVERRQKLALALELAVSLNPVAGVDGNVWQREQRRLPN